MYVGRFVIVGPGVGAYRVSSRSFPNRRIVDRDGTLTVTPTEDAPETDNPYISYNCVRTTDDHAVLGNGSHVDPITEKLDLGYPPRDALAEGLLALDYEKDDYDTPRVAGVIGTRAENRTESGEAADRSVPETEAFVGIVRRDALLVERVEEPTLVATYERDAPDPTTFTAETAADAAAEAYNLDFEHAVCAAGVVRTSEGFDLAIENREG